MRRVFAFLVIAVVACSDATEPLPDGWTPGGSWAGQVVVTRTVDSPPWASDPVTIQSAEVDGDSLELSVSFGGGCREHDFGLVTNGVFAESYPVQTWVKLAHDANGDMCRAMLARTLRFDLSPLKTLYNTSYRTTTGIMVIHVAAGFSVTYSW